MTTTITLTNGETIQVDVNVGNFDYGVKWQDDAGYHVIPWQNITRVDTTRD